MPPVVANVDILLDAAFQLDVPKLEKQNTQLTMKNNFVGMLKERLKHCRWSGLTDVRTVSYELTESSFFMADSDQTLHSAANLLDRNELQ